MAGLGHAENPLRVAIVGSGPSGFYAAEALLGAKLECEITIIDRLPTPFGLVRSGVAPDHPNLKQPAKIYDRIAQSKKISFLGNTEIGRDLTVEELRATHHAVIFAYGASAERALGVPGADLSGVYSAAGFVGWYNGHPDFRHLHFDLSQPAAVVIGQGNVALDVARILSKSVDDLKKTDIAKHALEVLAESQIRDIYVIGRRGPAQAKFSPQVLREWGKIANCRPTVRAMDLVLNDTSVSELKDKMNAAAATNLKILQEFSQLPPATAQRACHFRFKLDPVGVEGVSTVESLRCSRTLLRGEPFHQLSVSTGHFETIDCGAVFSSIGFRGVALPDLPFDTGNGAFRHSAGSINDMSGVKQPGLYTCGWIKRGASGTIGSNRADSLETVETLLADVGTFADAPKPGVSALLEYLNTRRHRWTSYADWQKIDKHEIELGASVEKPREKITFVADMLELLH